MNEIWSPTNEWEPSTEGWYLVVYAGHGKQYQQVDYWDADDMQWRAEYNDDDVRVTHYMPLPKMPPSA